MISDQSLLLSTIVLNDIYIYIYILYHIGALLGHNLIDTVDMTNQYDDYITNSTLKDLIRYVRSFLLG